MVNINIHIPEELHRALKFYALRHDQSLKELVTQILRTEKLPPSVPAPPPTKAPSVLVNINIRIPEDLHKQLKLDALMRDSTLKAHIIDLLKHFASQHDSVQA